MSAEAASTEIAEPAARAPTAKGKAKAKPDAKGKAKGKGKPSKPGKVDKAGSEATLPSIANHPRAGAQVARAKAWGGLGGFLLAAILSWRAGVPAADVLLRALLAGFAGYLGAWACAVVVWRHLVVAELRAVRAFYAARAEQAAQAAAAAEQSAQ